MSDFVYAAIVAFLCLVVIGAMMIKRAMPRNTTTGRSIMILGLCFVLFVFFSLPSELFKLVGILGLACVFLFLGYLVVTAPDSDIKDFFKGKLD